MNPAGAELLAAVERSPRAAGAHDRAAWVALFTEDGRIEDPVGSRPHIGHARIGRFYDTFIGPRQITFHRDVDIVSDTRVIRDLTLEVTMASSVTMMIPAFLRYDLRPTDGDWRIERLRAYWELSSMMRQFISRGTKSLPASAELSVALLRNQGIGGTAGFLSGFRGVGTRGKHLVASFLSAAVSGQSVIAPDGLARQLDGGRFTKLIAAGRSVAASVTTPAGRGVFFADVDRNARRITDIRYVAPPP